MVLGDMLNKNQMKLYKNNLITFFYEFLKYVYSTVTPSTPKMSVRVYIALRGSDSHEAGVARIAYQIEITGNSYYFIV